MVRVVPLRQGGKRGGDFSQPGLEKLRDGDAHWYCPPDAHRRGGVCESEFECTVWCIVWMCMYCNPHQKQNPFTRGDVVKDDSGSHAVFTEQRSSASRMTAANVLEVIVRLLECARRASESGVRRHPESKWRMLQHCWNFPKFESPRRMHSSIHDSHGQSPSVISQNQWVPFERDLCGHLLAGLLREKEFEQVLLRNGLDKALIWEVYLTIFGATPLGCPSLSFPYCWDLALCLCSIAVAVVFGPMQTCFLLFFLDSFKLSLFSSSLFNSKMAYYLRVGVCILSHIRSGHEMVSILSK